VKRRVSFSTTKNVTAAPRKKWYGQERRMALKVLIILSFCASGLEIEENGPEETLPLGPFFMRNVFVETWPSLAKVVAGAVLVVMIRRA
jgi:hypothetical protein